MTDRVVAADPTEVLRGADHELYHDIQHYLPTWSPHGTRHAPDYRHWRRSMKKYEQFTGHFPHQ